MHTLDFTLVQVSEIYPIILSKLLTIVFLLKSYIPFLTYVLLVINL